MPRSAIDTCKILNAWCAYVVQPCNSVQKAGMDNCMRLRPCCVHAQLQKIHGPRGREKIEAICAYLIILASSTRPCTFRPKTRTARPLGKRKSMIIPAFNSFCMAIINAWSIPINHDHNTLLIKGRDKDKC